MNNIEKPPTKDRLEMFVFCCLPFVFLAVPVAQTVLGSRGIPPPPLIPQEHFAFINPLQLLHYLSVVPTPFWASAAGVFAKANVDALETYIPQHTFPYGFRAITVRVLTSLAIGVIFFGWIAEEAKSIFAHADDPSSAFLLLGSYFAGAYLFCCLGHDFMKIYHVAVGGRKHT